MAFVFPGQYDTFTPLALLVDGDLTGANGSGTIVLARGKWNYFAIYRDVDTVSSYLFDRLAAQEGVDIGLLIDECKSYYGDRLVNFVPNSTPVGSKWDFDFVDEFGTPRGIWVKMKEYTHSTDDLQLSWSST